MKKKNRKPPTEPRPEVTWPALCAVVKRIIECTPTIDHIELKESVKERITRDGFKGPDSPRVCRAIDAIENAYPKLRREPPVWMPAPETIPLGLTTIELEDWVREHLRFVQQDPGFTSVSQIASTIETMLVARTGSSSSQP